MGFSLLASRALIHYGEAHYGKEYQQNAHEAPEVSLFIKKTTILLTVLEVFEHLGVLFALVASCHYSLTGNLLSSDAQLYTLLGVASLSITICAIVTGARLYVTLGKKYNKPDTQDRKEYIRQQQKRCDQAFVRAQFFYNLIHSMLVISALFAVTLSCHYFRTDNFLSSDTMAYSLMVGGTGSLVALQLPNAIINAQTNIILIDSINMSMRCPKGPDLKLNVD